jgi:hypothetical protein
MISASKGIVGVGIFEMPVGHTAVYIPVVGMIDDILQHIPVIEEFMFVYIGLVHEMDIVVQTAPVIQQGLDRDFRVGEAGQVFGYRIMDIQFAVLPELQGAHGRKGLGHGSQVKAVWASRNPFVPWIPEAFVSLIEYDAVLGDQDAAIEPSGQHRIEKMPRDSRIMFLLRTRQRRGAVGPPIWYPSGEQVLPFAPDHRYDTTKATDSTK